MHRINGAGSVNGLFVTADPVTNRPPTEITDSWLNTMQEELATFVEWSGQALSVVNRSQLISGLLAKFPLISGIQNQAYTSFTTAGSATVLTGSVNPPLTAYAAGQRFRVKFHVAITSAATTLNINNIGSVALKQYDAFGNKVNAVIAVLQTSDVEYDGAYFVVLNPTTNGNGVVSKSVAGNASIILTSTDVNAAVLVLTGAITGNINVIFPAFQNPINIINSTTGAYTVTCKTAAGTGAVVMQSGSLNCYGDGVNLVPIFFSSLAVGAIAHFAMTAAPVGWLKANGAAVSRFTYAALFAAIGTTFGVGDGATTFNLPDLRGEFLRGWDDSRGIDAGRYFGSNQAATRIYDSLGNLAGPSRVAQSVENQDDILNDVVTNYNPATPASSTYTRYRYGVRPRNVALLACISY